MIVTEGEVWTALQKQATKTAGEEAMLHLIHPLAEAVLKDWMQSNLEYQQYTEYLPIGQWDVDEGNTSLDNIKKSGGRAVVYSGGDTGTDVLQLKNLPVAKASLAVYEDVGAYGGQSSSPYPASTLLTLGEDYYLDVEGDSDLSKTGFLYRFGAWPVEPRSVKVTYYGGHTAAQFAADEGGSIKMAALITVVNAFKQFVGLKGNAIGQPTSESLGKYSRSLASAFGNGIFTVPYEAQMLLSKKRNMGRLWG